MTNVLPEIDESPVFLTEQELPSFLAEHYQQIFTEHHILEGASFDRDGHLIFTNPSGGRLMKMSGVRDASVLYTFDEESPAGSAIHQDGRIFLAMMNSDQTRGRIISLTPDGKVQQDIVSVERGYVPNDLVFDESGGFYFTDFRGTATDPAGGVYHVSSDYQKITPVLTHISLANGVALSPDGLTLWVTEYARNQLYRLTLSGPGETQLTSSAITYRFTGPSPDSMRTDQNGNVYVSMMQHGRILIFSGNGVPVSQILLPDRKHGRNLDVASLALCPVSRKIIIVAGDIKGASLFTAEGLSEGTVLYSHYPI